MKIDLTIHPFKDAPRFPYVVLIIALLMCLSFGLSTRAFGTDEVVLNNDLRDHLYSLDSLLSPVSDTPVNLQDRVVVVTFFASWCPPCRDEFKALNELQRQLEHRPFSIVAINVFEEFDDNDEMRMSQFLQETNPRFPVLSGTEATRNFFGGVSRIPTLFVFDQTGSQAFSFIHARGATKMSVDTSELYREIEPLL